MTKNSAAKKVTETKPAAKPAVKATKKPSILAVVKDAKKPAAKPVAKAPEKKWVKAPAVATTEKKPAPKKLPAKKPAAEKKGTPKSTKPVHAKTFLAKSDAQRCANLGIKTYSDPEDKDGMPYVIEAGQFVTNWALSDSAKSLALSLADFIEAQRKEAVEEATESDDE